MKTTAVICLSSIILTGNVFADEMKKGSPPPSLTQPCFPKTYCCSNVIFDVYGQWLYLQPNGSNLYYAAEAFPFNTSIALPPASPNWTVFEIDPNYHSGFQVGTQFTCPRSSMSLELNWERLHSSDSDSMVVSPQSYGTGNMVGPFFDIGPNSAAYNHADGKAFFHFDAVNLLFGKSVCFTNGLKARFYTGAGFARIKQNVSSFYWNKEGQTARGVSEVSTFTSGGPEFGVDFDYKLGKGFSFTGGSSMALYMGQMKNHTTYTSYSPALTTQGIPQPNIQGTTVPNRTQVVPGFEEKLGFSYVGSYDRCQFTVGLGYQLQIFIDAIQSVDMTAPQVLPPLVAGVSVNMGVYSVGFERTLSNFILSGPYASFSLDF
ncbi:MAG: hypothetical protein JSS32_00575 [Verrucomicrobia bacterium]|nr:hypothetical protein [Verrucomicrobiota bacterium]